MGETRRWWIMRLGVGSAMLLAARPGWPQRAPQPLPSPNAPNPAYPPGLSGPEQAREPQNRDAEAAKQQELRAEVEKLYHLAYELRSEVAKSDARATLSVTFVKKAEEAEKVAKRVKSLAKG